MIVALEIPGAEEIANPYKVDWESYLDIPNVKLLAFAYRLDSLEIDNDGHRIIYLDK